MTPKEIAAKLRELADAVAALELEPNKPVPNDPHWLEYPLRYRPIVVTGEFGEMYTIGGKTWLHEGIDFSVPIGTPVYACSDGKIVFSGVRSGYGNCVRLEGMRDNERVWTWYGHLSVLSVMSGTRVKVGDMLGLSGNTGNATGPHLHLTVQSESNNFIGAGWSESLRGSINPRDLLKWPTA